MFRRPVNVAKSTPKWILASNIVTIRIDSTATLSKYPMLAFFVLNPLVATADMACVSASNQFMPASFNASVEQNVSPR